MWIRGSLPRGCMRVGWSDIDLFALVQGETAVRWEALILPANQEKQIRKLLPVGYQEVQWEMMYSTFTEYDVAAMPQIAMIIQTQSLCWWGTDISPYLPRYQAGREMSLNHRWLAMDWQAFQAGSYSSTAEVRSFLKTLIRTAFELVMGRVGKYTPDLYWCVKSFSQYYPAKGSTLKKILNLYDQPLKEKYQLTALLEEITPWILSESKQQIS